MSRITRRHAMIAGALAAPAVIRPAWAARIVLKFATDMVDTHPAVVRTREAAEAIRRDTAGQVELRLFTNGQLGAAQELLNQVRSGAVDFFPAAAAGLSALVPVTSISSMGFAFADYGQVWTAMDGKLGAFIRDQVAATGSVEALPAMWDNGFRQITNSRGPVGGPEDLKGLKLRVPLAPLYTSMFSAFGAAPTPLSIAELYTGLQTRLVDGQENPLAIIDLFKLYEVQKYCSLSNHMWDGFWILVNQRSWARIPGDARKVVGKHLDTAAKAMRADVATLGAREVDRLRAQGMAVGNVDPAAFRAVLTRAGFYTTWRKEYGEAAWSALEAASGPLS